MSRTNAEPHYRTCQLCGKPVLIAIDSPDWNERYDYPCHRVCMNSGKAKVTEAGFLRYDQLQQIIVIAREIHAGTRDPAGYDFKEYIKAIVRTAAFSDRRNAFYAAKTLWILDHCAWDVPLNERTGKGSRSSLANYKRRQRGRTSTYS